MRWNSHPLPARRAAVVLLLSATYGAGCDDPVEFLDRDAPSAQDVPTSADPGSDAPGSPPDEDGWSGETSDALGDTAGGVEDAADPRDTDDPADSGPAADAGPDGAGDSPDAGDPISAGLTVLSAGQVASAWGGDAVVQAFDAAGDPPYGSCVDPAAGTETCPSLDWSVVEEVDAGAVLELRYSDAAVHAGLVVGPSAPVDVSAFAGGTLAVDVRVVDAGDAGLAGGLVVKVESAGGDSGELALLGVVADGEWHTAGIPVASLTASGGLDLSAVTVPLVVFPPYGTAAGVTLQLGHVRFTGDDVGLPDTPPGPTPDGVMTFGAGTVATSFDPAAYDCTEDFGFWVSSAGVVQPGVGSCAAIGTPVKLSPQVVGEAAEQPVAAHRWWGSLSFLGEMTIGDPNSAAYITPDPIAARVSERGVRLAGIPAGLGLTGDGFLVQVPDPFAEVFDGLAVGNTAHLSMQGGVSRHSDGSVTFDWRAGASPGAVMRATFVHGSPYVTVEAFDGQLEIRPLRVDGPEKGTFCEGGDSLGVWTDVAGNRNAFLIVGEGDTTFTNITGNTIGVVNAANALTVAWLPVLDGVPDAATCAAFEARARNVVHEVRIDHAVDPATQAVTVTHAYLDADGAPVDTMIGLHPLHWKRSDQPLTAYSARSARGVVRFAETSGFSYEMPFVGALPHLPTDVGSADPTVLAGLVADFMAEGAAAWNPYLDTYWSGKAYGRAAELAALARGAGLVDEADTLIAFLKAELEDWFTVTPGETARTFVYDEEWSTLLGVKESFGAHLQLNDHHFHYGYFVRAAAEICRVDAAWCGADQFGPMVDLLIRDYAGGRGDPMFPRLRHFDPANGFSWASGMANFALGNNNESTSEAANAYGAMILYGLVTGQPELVARGVYLHASTAAAYWEYWADIDGYAGLGDPHATFPPGYGEITTSIVWGQGAVFATWFSPAPAHILGIQGLPMNPLTVHVSQYADYMAAYVARGLTEAANGAPSGLPDGHWRDIWWMLQALHDADAALADYGTVGSSYAPEEGCSKAHTYHWLHAVQALGQLATGTGALTADHPAAMAFEEDGVTTYLAYNFGATPLTVTFSDGQTVTAAPNAMGMATSD